MPGIGSTIALAGMALALSACGRADHQAPAPKESLRPLPSAQPEPPVPAPEASASQAATAQDECGAAALAAYIGKPASGETIAAIRAAARHDRVRVIHPGDVVTMDLRPDRLNVEVAENGRIQLLRCG